MGGAPERQRIASRSGTALVVETAREAGCAVVYSEDLQAGRDFDGVRIENPFA